MAYNDFSQPRYKRMAVEGMMPEQNSRGPASRDYTQDLNAIEDKVGTYDAASMDAGEPANEGGLDFSSMAKTAANQAGSGANKEQQAGSLMMATGNPYAMAAGLGLSVVGAKKARERQMEQDDVNNKIQQRYRLAQLMSNLGSGIGSIG